MDDDMNKALGIACETEISENRIVEPTVSTVREELNTHGNWSELPDLPLEKIYSFLGRSDQVNMSLVCRKWYAGFGSPSVWKTFIFAPTAPMLSTENCPVLKFVTKYCSMFRHVHIYYRLAFMVLLDFFLIYTWCRRVVVFLEHLMKNSQLKTICINNLNVCFGHVDSNTNVSIKKSIASFLGTQRYLKRIELINFSKYLQDYEQILKDLHKNSRDSITQLSILGLNHASYSEYMEPNGTVEEIFLSIINFPNLEVLRIDYSNIFVETFSCQSAAMKIFENCQMRAKLSTICLYWIQRSGINNNRWLTSADWQFLRKLCPNLRVELNFQFRTISFRAFLSSLLEMEFMIVKDMPIVDLGLAHFESTRSPGVEIHLLLAHFLQCQVTAHLEYFTIKWLFPITDIASTFIPFLQGFRKLKYFRLFVTYPANGIDLLMESWLKNRPESLQKVYISIQGLENAHDYNILQKLTVDYTSRLELVGLNVKVDIFKEIQTIR